MSKIWDNNKINLISIKYFKKILKFEEFWSILKKELKKQKKLKTLVYKREFLAYLRDENTIIITPKSTLNSKVITKSQAEKAWNIAKKIPISSRFTVWPYRKNVRGSSYIVTFLYHYLGTKKVE